MNSTHSLAVRMKRREVNLWSMVCVGDSQHGQSCWQTLRTGRPQFQTQVLPGQAGRGSTEELTEELQSFCHREFGAVQLGAG